MIILLLVLAALLAALTWRWNSLSTRNVDDLKIRVKRLEADQDQKRR